MDALSSRLHSLASTGDAITPRLLNRSSSANEEALHELLEKGEIVHVCDDYQEQSRELFAILNPSLVYTPEFETHFNEYYQGLPDPLRAGIWVHFPWRAALVHVLAAEDFYLVRTARNQNLIAPLEQQKFYNAHIGIAGLSVGSSVACALVLQGGAKNLRLADMDRLALSNMNRILTGVHELGELKVHMAARRLYEMNPFAHIETFPDGLTEKNIEAFFDGLDI